LFLLILTISFFSHQQLATIANTDVLIGMHGAGLVHTLYLPPHAQLVEIYPKSFAKGHNPFKAIAGWRGLGYHTWRNEDSMLEGAQAATIVPAEIMEKLVTKAKRQLCGG
jgi:capsular polysaccharide biosynthesis protein